MRLMVLSVAMLATVGAVNAAKENEIYDTMACMAQPDADARLSCNAKLQAGEDPFKDIPTGRWRIKVDKNPLHDTKTVVASLYASEGDNSRGDRVQLFARCDSNETEAYIAWITYLGNDSGDFRNEWKRVTVRIGDAKAKTERWLLSTNSQSTFAPGWGGSFLKEIAAVDRLIVQTTPFKENPIMAIFDTRGAKEAFKELSEACGWSIDAPSKKK